MTCVLWDVGQRWKAETVHLTVFGEELGLWQMTADKQCYLVLWLTCSSRDNSDE